MTQPDGYIRNCLIVNRAGSEEAMFLSDGTPYLDGFAIIPMELFNAMGGIEHPAYVAGYGPARKQSDDREGGSTSAERGA